MSIPLSAEPIQRVTLFKKAERASEHNIDEEESQADNHSADEQEEEKDALSSDEEDCPETVSEDGNNEQKPMFHAENVRSSGKLTIAPIDLAVVEQVVLRKIYKAALAKLQARSKRFVNRKYWFPSSSLVLCMCFPIVAVQTLDNLGRLQALISRFIVPQAPPHKCDRQT